jgi:hypothetical protein
MEEFPGWNTCLVPRDLHSAAGNFTVIDKTFGDFSRKSLVRGIGYCSPEF